MLLVLVTGVVGSLTGGCRGGDVAKDSATAFSGEAPPGRWSMRRVDLCRRGTVTDAGDLTDAVGFSLLIPPLGL